ncbi:MAG: DUF4252 domain-containing protein [Bacteroidota bacterium]
MRSPIIIILALLASSYTFAQTAVERFFAQHSQLENVNKFSLQGGLLQLFSNDLADTNAQKTMRKLNQLSAIWVEDFNPIDTRAVKSLLKNLQKDAYEPLIMAKDGSASVNFLLQENRSGITGVVLVVDDDDHFLLVHLTGNLQFEDLSNVDFDIEGMDHFKKLPKSRDRLKRA